MSQLLSETNSPCACGEKDDNGDKHRSPSFNLSIFIVSDATPVRNDAVTSNNKKSNFSCQETTQRKDTSSTTIDTSATRNASPAIGKTRRQVFDDAGVRSCDVAHDMITCFRRNMVEILTIITLFILVGAVTALGWILFSADKETNENGGSFGTGLPLQENKNDLVPSVVAGVVLFDTDTQPNIEEDLSSFCTSESSYSELPLNPGIGQLKGKNPLVGVDGMNAIIVTGSGYVSFYSFQDSSWQRGETFGILASHGDIASVSISGRTAVIGLPQAIITEGTNEPVKTGMVITYEQNSDTGRWRQAKELVPDEYREGALKYQESDFGLSVSLHNNLLVVGAPSEESNLGSITVFRKDTIGSWGQVDKLQAPEADTCQDVDDVFFGYSVQLHQTTIAASADCKENIVFYEYNQTDSVIKRSRVLRWIDRRFGAIASIAINTRYLIYSTVRGGLFIFSRPSNSEFVLSQEFTFDSKLGLFEYPVVISNNLLVLAVDNKFKLYTQTEQGDKWTRESVVLVSDGNFNAYEKPGLSVSNGQILLGSNTNIEAYDFSRCVPETVPQGAVKPTPQTAPVTTCKILEVSLNLDKYPQDNSWRITDSTGDVVAKSPPYDASMASSNQKERHCLQVGTYSFDVYDFYEDGMCCNWGVGNYTLLSEGGEVLAAGGEWLGFSESKMFQLT